jgi:hypothetical protein
LSLGFAFEGLVAPVAAQEAGAAATFANPVVNNPANDDHPRHANTTSIVLGSGSTVIAAFNTWRQQRHQPGGPVPT